MIPTYEFLVRRHVPEPSYRRWRKMIFKGIPVWGFKIAYGDISALKRAYTLEIRMLESIFALGNMVIRIFAF